MKPYSLLLFLFTGVFAQAEGQRTYEYSNTSPLNALQSTQATEEIGIVDNNAIEEEIFPFLTESKQLIILIYLVPIAIILGISIKTRNLKSIVYDTHLQNESGKTQVVGTTDRKKSCELNTKARELIPFTLAMIQKQNTLTQIGNELDHLAQIPESTCFLETTIGKQLSSIVNETCSITNKNYWDDFLLSFQAVYPNYFSNLRLRTSEITEKELKLAALLRLGLDTKKIASLLNLSPESVKVFRHRLRKKIGLSENDNFYTCLSKFD